MWLVQIIVGKLFGNSWGNSQTMFSVLDFMYHFICGDVKWCWYVPEFYVGDCGSWRSSDSTKFWYGQKNKQELKFWCGWNIWFYEILLWFEEMLLVILVFSLYSLHILYCIELFIQFTIFFINSHSVISVGRYYFQNLKNQTNI